MSKLNRGISIGHSSNPMYDECAYNDYLRESVSPMLYKLNPDQNNNCQACLTTFGPRPSMGARSFGVSNFVGDDSDVPSQDLVDTESILSNRNVIASRCKDGKVNDIDVTQFKLRHARVCNDFLSPIDSLQTAPRSNYREIGTNRFLDLPKNPQLNIFYPFDVNTRLEAKDNYNPKIPKVITYDLTRPQTIKGRNKVCKYKCGEKCPKEKNDDLSSGFDESDDEEVVGNLAPVHSLKNKVPASCREHRRRVKNHTKNFSRNHNENNPYYQQ